ncbi:TetR/AcrR family transcriptional regulator [Methylobacterium sp. ID0610]|uniref:TetR/AcrR family transcriptional regulator n=1 Tax=Methylobacterium carpenticola TaxID=3344827 RepID=UPI0036C0F77B
MTTENLIREPEHPGREPDNPGSRDLRCRILAIAERLFRDLGYRKTTVADIAADLRMSPGNVYRFFPSKKALNEAVAARLLAGIEAELRAIATRPGVPAPQRLREFLVTLHSRSAQQFTANRRMHEMVEVAMAESWDVVHCHIGAVDRMLCRLVAEGAEAGEFDVADPMAAARCVHAAFVRFCHPALIAQCADEAGPTLDEMIAFVLAGLRAR